MSGNPAKTKKSAYRLLIEQRRAEVERLWGLEYTIEETAREMKICERTVKNYREKTFDLFRERQLMHREQRVVIRARELEIIKREAMRDRQKALDAYEISKEPDETIEITREVDGSIKEPSKIKERGQAAGDSRFLVIANKCLETYGKANAELRKLYGDDTPTTDEHVHVHAHAHQHQIAVVEDERWYGNDAHSKSTEAAAAPIAGLIESVAVQGGGLRPTVGKNGNGSAHGH